MVVVFMTKSMTQNPSPTSSSTFQRSGSQRRCPVFQRRLPTGRANPSFARAQRTNRPLADQQQPAGPVRAVQRSARSVCLLAASTERVRGVGGPHSRSRTVGARLAERGTVRFGPVHQRPDPAAVAIHRGSHHPAPARREQRAAGQGEWFMCLVLVNLWKNEQDSQEGLSMKHELLWKLSINEIF